jgi:hypothetical protein
LSGSIKALNSSPLVASGGGNVKADEQGVHMAGGGSRFDYIGKIKVKNGRITGGYFTEYSRVHDRDSIRVTGLKVPAKEMLPSIPFLTLPDAIKSELLSYGGGESGDSLPSAYGFGGRDAISGDYHYIRGGADADALTGGKSANIFIFETPDKNGVDLITNFIRSEGDRLQISLANNYNGGFSYSQSVANNGDTAQVGYSGTDAFSTAAERFHLNTSTGGLFFDADGNGGASAPRQIAVLTGLSDLQLSDFQFVY